jgi:3-hydroxyisobutyrate dehydrogenase-like beta-hydroxyacid dehydrogenase
MDIGVIGLGNMGAAIAANLIAAGHSLTVYNRTASKAKALLAQGAMLAHDPAGTAGGDIVITMLSDDHALENIVFGAPGDDDQGLIAHQGQHTIHVSMSTVSMQLSRRIEQASIACGRPFISATVIGRPDVAERGELILMAAGERQLIEKCQPAFAVIAKSIHIIGEQAVQANV